MFSHITVGTDDVPRVADFYDALFVPLGILRFWTEPNGRAVGWQRDGAPGRFFLTAPFDGRPATPGNGSMCAFTAPSRAAVELAHAAALAQGGADEGRPGPRPQYGPDYFGAYLRDPEGNKLHVVYRGS